MRWAVDLMLPVAFAALLWPQAGVAAAQSEWVHPGADGKLVYKTLPGGDRIPDFSHAGYGGGGVALPVVPVKKTVTPSGDDDSTAIQSALDAVGALPMQDGFRGAVLLAAGTFHCASPITIKQSGVVLRGSGAGDGGTVIEMTGAPHVCLNINGKEGAFKPKVDSAPPMVIADAYVPAGALEFSVKDAAGLRAGDVVFIRRPVTEAWIHFMGMDELVRNGHQQFWMSDDGQIIYERTVQAITGNRLTLDVPLPDAIDARFLTPDVATVAKITPARRIGHCGIESLQVVSSPPKGTLLTKNNGFAGLDYCEDCWIKDVNIHDTLGDVDVWYGGRRITLEQVHAFHTATVAKGAGYPADFSLRGSQVLIDRCSSTGNGSFYVATLNPSATLNVVLNSQFTGNGAVQPHMHWSTGLLVDSCQFPEGRIELINRGTSGSGHGWAIGWGVAWNCTAKTLDFQQPPGSMNWCIGCTGQLNRRGAKPGPWLSSLDTPVEPRSLYLAQLRERLGPQALANIGY
jgi:hypothetical protein